MIINRKYGGNDSGNILRIAIGISLLAILLLVSSAGAAPYAYVANSGSNNVSVIDTATNTVTATINVGRDPVGVAVNPAGTKAYVANFFDNTISVIDTATNTVTATVNVGYPVGVAVNPAGTKAYVASYGGFNCIGFCNGVSVIDTATNTVTATMFIWATQALAVNPQGTKVYVTSGGNSVSVIDTATNTVTTTVTVGSYPDGVVVNPTGTRVYVANSGSNNVSVIDTATNTVTATINVGNYPKGVAVNPAGTPTPPTQLPPEIVRVETFREGDLVFLRLIFTDPNNDAEGFGFRGAKGSGWAEETHPFLSPSYGRVSPGQIEYPFNLACETGPAYESDVEAWIYDSTGLISPSVTVHLACMTQTPAPTPILTPSPTNGPTITPPFVCIGGIPGRCNVTQKLPVIFIPGILGSKLEAKETFNSSPVPSNCQYSYNKNDTIWFDASKAIPILGRYNYRADCAFQYLDALQLKDDGKTPLYPVDLSGEILDASILGPFVNEPYYETITSLEGKYDYQLDKDLFIFPYDWRKDIRGTTEQLDNLITNVTSKAGTQKVNIIAHSMGGLVAREYIRDSQHAKKVDTLVELGTPNLGSVDFLAFLLYNKPFGPFGVVNGYEANKLVQNWTGAFELLPSKKYYELYSDSNEYPFNDLRDIDNNNITGPLNYSQLKILLTNLNKNMYVFNNTEKFHEDLDQSYSNTNGVNVYLIAGSGFPTIGQIRDYEKTQLPNTFYAGIKWNLGALDVSQQATALEASLRNSYADTDTTVLGFPTYGLCCGLFGMYDVYAAYNNIKTTKNYLNNSEGDGNYNIAFAHSGGTQTLIKKLESGAVKANYTVFIAPALINQTQVDNLINSGVKKVIIIESTQDLLYRMNVSFERNHEFEAYQVTYPAPAVMFRNLPPDLESNLTFLCRLTECSIFSSIINHPIEISQYINTNSININKLPANDTFWVGGSDRKKQTLFKNSSNVIVIHDMDFGAMESMDVHHELLVKTIEMFQNGVYPFDGSIDGLNKVGSSSYVKSIYDTTPTSPAPQTAKIIQDATSTNGDGTVPLKSATLGQKNNVYYVKQEHINLPTGTALFLAVSLLNGNSDIIDGVRKDPFPFSGSIISIYSPVNLHAYDAQNNHVGITINRTVETNIPGSTYDELGESKFIYLPDGGHYRITTNATGEGSFDLKLRRYNESTLQKELSYLNVNQTNQTTTYMLLDSDTPILFVDRNGDGKTVQQLPPTSIILIPSVRFTTDKDIYAQGEQVIFTLINNGTDVIDLPNSAPWWVENATTGERIFSPIAAQVITQLDPGKSKSWIWDQNDSEGRQVQPGTYRGGISSSIGVNYTKEFEIATAPLITPTPTVTPPAGTCLGDITGDSNVNSDDFVLFAIAYNSASGDLKYNVKADMNNDGVINSEDFVLFASAYGKAC